MKAAWSVGRRLSVWLALQGLAVMAVICVVVYIDARANLSERQAEALANKRTQVEHLLQEIGIEAALPQARHKLDDYFVGHEDVSLQVRDAAGATVYDSTLRGSKLAGERSMRFEVPRFGSAATPLTATLYLDTRSDARLLQRLSVTLVLAAVGAAALAAATGYLLVRTGLAPIRQLAQQTRRLGASTLNRRLTSEHQPEEVQPMVEQFNELLTRLDHAYTQLEAFNSDVAHELCTPLATLINSSEVALRRARDEVELEAVIGSNLEELRRLAEIVQDMLFLSRADRGARARRVHTHSLAAVAKDVGEYHDAAIEAAGLRLEIQGDAEGSFDVPLLRRALSNLLVNATRYAVAGSSIRVVVTESGPGRVRLSVANRGPRIEPADLPRIFDRFYRADKARSPGNFGLGLAIVAAIARMHEGHVLAGSAQGSTEVGMVIPQHATAADAPQGSSAEEAAPPAAASFRTRA